MRLSDVVYTFGQYLLARHGERVHKLAIDAAFTCPNRDGSKGRGGCTFCNNVSFSPHGRQPAPVAEQLEAGRAVLAKRTGARKFLAYFQAYTNTYADVETLRALYDQALATPGVIGLSVGTRPENIQDSWLEISIQQGKNRQVRRMTAAVGYPTLRLIRVAIGCWSLGALQPGQWRETSSTP